MQEIERKFLTKEIPFSLEGFPLHQISQSYLHLSPTIRIRQMDMQFFLTIKGKGDLSREEFELEISKEEYAALQKKAETPAVEKKRYLIPLEKGLTAEVDVYEGGLAGLMTTEVEFSSEREARDFVPPHWFGKDVTADKRYKNTSLALYGVPLEKD